MTTSDDEDTDIEEVDDDDWDDWYWSRDGHVISVSDSFY